MLWVGFQEERFLGICLGFVGVVGVVLRLCLGLGWQRFRLFLVEMLIGLGVDFMYDFDRVQFFVRFRESFILGRIANFQLQLVFFFLSGLIRLGKAKSVFFFLTYFLNGFFVILILVLIFQVCFFFTWWCSYVGVLRKFVLWFFKFRCFL